MDGKLLSNKLRFLLGILVFILTTAACATKITERPPCLFVQNKIPFRVAMIVPDDIRARECKHAVALNFTKFACGSTLYETCVKTMERTFVEVKTVKDISEANQPWDRVLSLELDDFKMIKTETSLNDLGDVIGNRKPVLQICLTFRYKIADKDNKELFSSKIVSEENLFNYMLTPQQGNNLRYEQRAFINVVNKTMLKMVEETMSAYKNGQL